MKISEESKEELLKLSRSADLREDMQTLRRNRHNPFFKDGRVDADAYIEFVTEYNKFINHSPKPFRRIIDKDMRL